MYFELVPNYFQASPGQYQIKSSAKHGESLHTGWFGIMRIVRESYIIKLQ